MLTCQSITPSIPVSPRNKELANKDTIFESNCNIYHNFYALLFFFALLKTNVVIVILFILGFGSTLTLAQQVPTGFLLRGYILGADTTNTIPLANILKKPSGERYISNRFGAFGIRVQEGDTLVFSVIGYQNYILPVKKYVVNNLTDPIRVRMKSTVYKLKEAEVNYNQKKKDSVARAAAKILKTSPLLNDYNHQRSWILGYTGAPLSDLLSQGSSRLAQYQKIERLRALYYEQEMVDHKYTNELVVRATGMPVKRVSDFKKFCNLPHYFILNSNDYDLVLAIRNCYEDFKKTISN